MLKKLTCLVAFTCLASPAWALQIVNLDEVEHRVMFESGSAQEVYVLQPDETVYTAGRTNGFISLLSAPKPSKGKGIVQSDGILSGVIAGERTMGIPAEGYDVYAIWPGGKIGLQQRRRGDRMGR